MIKIKFSKDTKDNLSLVVKGHADYGEHGQDPCCAAVTILCYTLANLVLSMEAGGGLAGRPMIKLESGDAVIKCTPNSTSKTDLVKMYLFSECGFKILEENYPDNVKIIKTLL